MKSDSDFPVAGDKLKYKGVQNAFWFTDIIQNAKNNLVKGKTYTLKTIEIFSSWCCITNKRYDLIVV